MIRRSGFYLNVLFKLWISYIFRLGSYTIFNSKGLFEIDYTFILYFKSSCFSLIALDAPSKHQLNWRVNNISRDWTGRIKFSFLNINPRNLVAAW